MVYIRAGDVVWQLLGSLAQFLLEVVVGLGFVIQAGGTFFLRPFLRPFLSPLDARQLTLAYTSRATDSILM